MDRVYGGVQAWWERHPEHSLQGQGRAPGGPAAELDEAFGEGELSQDGPYLLELPVAGLFEPDDEAESAIAGEGSHHRCSHLYLIYEVGWHEVAKRREGVRGYK